MGVDRLMTGTGYGSHPEYMSRVAVQAATRQRDIEKALHKAFERFLETRTTEVIVFSDLTVDDLTEAILKHPGVLKPLLAICNVAARALERDLNIKNIDTLNPKLSERRAAAIAGYIRPFLPAYISISALTELDRVLFVDKEIRKYKGRWERSVLQALNRFATAKFKKRKFAFGGELFEIDAATPESGSIEVAVDVKRIEARRDIHKRCDEIVNKAVKLKAAYPEAQFAAVIYYPFVDEHINVQNRLKSDNIDIVVFASESEESIRSAIQMLLAQLGKKR